MVKKKRHFFARDKLGPSIWSTTIFVLNRHCQSMKINISALTFIAIHCFISIFITKQNQRNSSVMAFMHESEQCVQKIMDNKQYTWTKRIYRQIVSSYRFVYFIHVQEFRYSFVGLWRVSFLQHRRTYTRECEGYCQPRPFILPKQVQFYCWHERWVAWKYDIMMNDFSAIDRRYQRSSQKNENTQFPHLWIIQIVAFCAL